MEFSKFVRRNRERLGLSQGALAKRVELSREYINHIEQGRMPHEKTQLALIATLAPDARTRDRYVDRVLAGTEGTLRHSDLERDRRAHVYLGDRHGMLCTEPAPGHLRVAAMTPDPVGAELRF